jgi:hypothetical protein
MAALDYAMFHKAFQVGREYFYREFDPEFSDKAVAKRMRRAARTRKAA